MAERKCKDSKKKKKKIDLDFFYGNEHFTQ